MSYVQERNIPFKLGYCCVYTLHGGNTICNAAKASSLSHGHADPQVNKVLLQMVLPPWWVLRYSIEIRKGPLYDAG